MIATIRFKIPEEREEFEMAVNAGKMYSVLFEIKNEILHRKREFGSDEQDALFNIIRDEILDAIREGGVEL